MNKIKTIPFSAEQQAVINTRKGKIAIVATAGSGKTATLVERYTRIRKEGANVNDVLCLTFTREAAKNMRKRANEQETGTRPSGFLTFHSLALSFATMERDNFPFELAAFPLINDGQKMKFVFQSNRRYPGVDYKQFINWMSQQKRKGIQPDMSVMKAMDANEYHMAHCYKEFEGLCKANGVLDFDDLIIEMVEVLENRPDVLERWSYEWIQADEMQDADEVQIKLLQLLSQKYGNVFAVGDANQEIYSWRMNSSGLFLKFHEFFPDANYLFLSENFRATPELTEFCRQIAPIDNELRTKMNSRKLSGPAPKIVHFPNAVEEAEKVCNAVKDDKNSAILARTNRQLRIYEDLLSAKGIKYHILGRAGFYAQEEIQNILAFVQIAYKPYDSAVLRALRSPFECTKFIKKKELSIVLQAQQKNSADTPSIFSLVSEYVSPEPQQAKAIEKFQNDLHAVRNSANGPASVVVNKILEITGAWLYLDGEEQSGEMDNSSLDNIKELLNIAGRFPNIEMFLEHVRRVQAASKSRTGVALGTIHSAKGLEFDNVYVISTNIEYIPHPKGDLEEEKRLFYVACSRAARKLGITYWGVPSPLIKEFLPKEPVRLVDETRPTGTLNFMV